MIGRIWPLKEKKESSNCLDCDYMPTMTLVSGGSSCSKVRWDRWGGDATRLISWLILSIPHFISNSIRNSWAYLGFGFNTSKVPKRNWCGKSILKSFSGYVLSVVCIFFLLLFLLFVCVCMYCDHVVVFFLVSNDSMLKTYGEPVIWSLEALCLPFSLELSIPFSDARDARESFATAETMRDLHQMES